MNKEYCKEHRSIVDEINKSRHKNCCIKEKIVNEIINYRDNFNLGKITMAAKQLTAEENHALFIINLKNKILNGDFDNRLGAKPLILTI